MDVGPGNGQYINHSVSTVLLSTKARGIFPFASVVTIPGNLFGILTYVLLLSCINIPTPLKWSPCNHHGNDSTRPPGHVNYPPYKLPIFPPCWGQDVASWQPFTPAALRSCVAQERRIRLNFLQSSSRSLQITTEVGSHSLSGLDAVIHRWTSCYNRVMMSAHPIDSILNTSYASNSNSPWPFLFRSPPGLRSTGSARPWRGRLRISPDRMAKLINPLMSTSGWWWC